MDAASAHLPHTGTFQLKLSHTLLLPSEIFARFSRCLRYLKGLEFISFSNGDVALILDEDAVQDHLKALRVACPMLKAFRFHNRAWRKQVDGAWNEVSINDFFAVAGISWV
ncbi:hypothetical protein K438DRAFT_1960481 [Mycena galopus ATCC 62051]|nr:hypothetical protein K438DRAFT_1960481 [Mycena galopus ATCC 62051]